MSQCEILMDAFDRGESLTVLTALQRYGVYALSQRAGELVSKHHYPVTIRSVRTDTGKWISEYSRGGIAHG